MRGTSDEEGDTFISECIAFFNSVLAMGQCRNQNETCIGDEKNLYCSLQKRNHD